MNLVLIILLSMPCVLGYNLWAWDGFAVFGGAVLDVEDFLVSNLFLPLGSLVYLLFCVTRYGWGWQNYKKRGQHRQGSQGAGLDARLPDLCAAAHRGVHLCIWSLRQIPCISDPSVCSVFD